VSVLVLEAGAPNLNDPEIRMMLSFTLWMILAHAVYAVIPAILASQVGKPQYDWGFLSVKCIIVDSSSF
jgi:hypothetical protein